MTERASDQFVDISCQPLCKACSGETRTLYVYLCSGTLLKVGNMRGISVTDTDVIIECGDGHAVELRRSDVHFASCEACLPAPT